MTRSVTASRTIEKRSELYNDPVFLRSLLGVPIGNATNAAIKEVLSDETLTRVMHNGAAYAVSGREVCDYLKEKLGVYNTEDIADHIIAKINSDELRILPNGKKNVPINNPFMADLLRSAMKYNDLTDREGIGNIHHGIMLGPVDVPYNPIAINVPNPETERSPILSIARYELERGLDSIICGNGSKYKKVIEWADQRNIRLLTKVLIVLEDDSMAMKLQPKHAGLIMMLGDDAARMMLASPAAINVMDKNQIISLAINGKTAHLMGISESPYVGVLPEPVLAEIAKNNNPEIRAILLGNKNARRSLPERILADGITDDSCIVRKASAASITVTDAIPKQTVALLFKDPEHVVWNTACKNLDAILAADENEIDGILLKKKNGTAIIADTIKKANMGFVPASHAERFIHLKKLCENERVGDY